MTLALDPGMLRYSDLRACVCVTTGLCKIYLLGGAKPSGRSLPLIPSPPHPAARIRTTLRVYRCSGC